MGAILGPEAFDRLWVATRKAYNTAIELCDAEGALDVVDTWIECWRGVNPIPNGARVLQLALPGTIWSQDELLAMAYAEEIAALADRSETPDAPAIIRFVIEAFANVAEVTTTPALTREACEAAAIYAGRLELPHPAIDVEFARVLRNLAVDDDQLDSRREIVSQLRELSERQLEPVCAIDEHLSVALVCLSSSLGRGGAEHIEVVNELAALNYRWPLCLRIAGDYVAETWNAYICEGINHSPADLLEQFETIRALLPQPSDNIERALSYLRQELE